MVMCSAKCEVELGGDKRCTVSEFKGVKHVDLREWYRKVRVCG